MSRVAEAAARYWHDGPGCYLGDGVEPSLAAPEACGGEWGGNLVMGDTSDEEPWFVPVSLNGLAAENDR